MNIRLVRKKIKTVSSVKKITKAMELVSAIKMKKAQQKAIDGKPYQLNLDLIIKKIVGNVDVSYSNLLNIKPPTEKELMIIITSNKGLWSFNFNLFRFLIEKKIDFLKTDFITVGRKGSFLLIK